MAHFGCSDMGYSYDHVSGRCGLSFDGELFLPRPQTFKNTAEHLNSPPVIGIIWDIDLDENQPRMFRVLLERFVELIAHVKGRLVRIAAFLLQRRICFRF